MNFRSKRGVGADDLSDAMVRAFMNELSLRPPFCRVAAAQYVKCCAYEAASYRG
jgi:hypothetical protein